MWPRKPSGHGRQFMIGIVFIESWFESLCRYIHRVEELIHFKSVEAQTLHVGVVRKHKEWDTGSAVVLVT
ncbi:hypothetical protein TNCV_3449321 [Trichonephila clavipes]|nr:hypothetical protein TNCV_3449321 [Trichonephila clavipes]